ncbi:hypothetical protein LB467_10760 [Salegentibacter sp. JZCK2]|uniref:hypothetical protein n=1 Tax=Salegentibacter tibetensis TaxID=2873600 RepID=UPI001CCCE6FB|nr:hypothetical protein [Salegentibacter tibetensis]MBZ9730168.1 hypothetical protein [Salegentibacter tibetensis]
MFSKNRMNGLGINFPRFFLINIAFLFLYVFPPVYGQEKTKNDSIPAVPEQEMEVVSVFLDCDRCDNSFIRQEINYINFARDPKLAQIHLFITSNTTGSGGRLFTLSFIGKKEFEGTDNTLSYTSTQLNTRQEERSGLTTMIELGLIPYVAQTSLANYINIEVSNRPEQEEEVEDPWNNWIFEVYGGLSFEEETSQSSLDIRYGLFADYVTETWRIRLRPYFNYNQRDYIRNEEQIRSVINRDGFQGRVVRSISDHWSLGAFANININTFENIKFGYRVAPAIEYSLLPYKLALRKEYTIAYSLGYVDRKYFEETVFDKTEESLYNQSLKIGVRVLEPWGSVRAGIEGSHFLHDLSKYRISVDGRVSLRVFKGFSVDFTSSYDYVQDQLSLPKGDASLEDVLLQQRQLATTYGISLSVGLSYSFGSVYNNVVNTRL